MARKNISIAPLIQSRKKEDTSRYDALNSINRRISVEIRREIVSQFQEYADKITEKTSETFFLGYYIDGGYVGVLGNELKFQSPIDKFQYKQSQVKYFWSLFSTRTADPLNEDLTPFVNGQLVLPRPNTVPPLNSGAGELYHINMNIGLLGAVNCIVEYRDAVGGGVVTVTNDGIVAVYALCSRALT